MADREISKETGVGELGIKREKGKVRRIWWLLLICGVGVALLVFGGELGGGEQDGEDTEPLSLDADIYAEMLEEKVKNICSGVRGAGEVTVFVSLKGGYRTVYAYDSQSNASGYRSEIVMSGSGSGKQAVITAYENPEIAGIGIVCSGADDSEVRRQIISLVSAALAVPTNKIFVAAS